MRWRHSVLAGVTSALIALAAAAEQAGISVRDAWVRESPPGMAMTAGYMMLQNNTSRPQVLVAARSSAFETVTIHRTVARQGMVIAFDHLFLVGAGFFAALIPLIMMLRKPRAAAASGPVHVEME